MVELAWQRSFETIDVLICGGGVIGASIAYLLQYFDEGRVTDAPDVYANTHSAPLIGAGAGSLLTESIRWPFLSENRRCPCPNFASCRRNRSNRSILIPLTFAGYFPKQTARDPSGRSPQRA
jgi:hypothetical protein